LLLAVTLAWTVAGRPTGDFGRRPPAAEHLRTVVLTRPSQSSVPSIAVHRAGLSDVVTAKTGPVPVTVQISAIGLQAPVVPVGVAVGTRQMEVPQDVRTVGWYRFGPAPGQPGSAVLIGHVDSRSQGLGAFFGLRGLREGMTIRVGLTDGTALRFRVVARRHYGKADLPGALFARAGNPMLALITCGGTFNTSTRTYSDNVVVYALPAS
jgi:sortase (surface protein transpeptidase)